MSLMLKCPICKEEVISSGDAEDGDGIECENCGTILVVRDKRSFKSLELMGSDTKKGEPTVSL
jgi:DNA-directed RNA polymerase subunit RPC12/RpoP